MVNIEPYQYQKVTNIKEHNDIVAKINEIVDVINNTNLDTVIPRISKLETDVSEITANDSVQDNNISTLNTKTAKLEQDVSGLTDNDTVQNNDISSLKTKTAKLEQDVSGLTDNDGTQNNDISSLKTKTAKLEQDVSGINATDSLQWNDIETIKTDIDTINPKITKMEQDITTINGVNTVQSNDIKSIKDKNTEQDNAIATHTTEITGLIKSLVSNIALINGTTTGNMKVRVDREDAPSIDSNDYNIQKPTSVELVQGSAPAMVKAQITLSDGTVLISDDFMFTTEAIGQDVYISSFVFKNGNVAGTISADIGLSNGSTLEANNFAVPTDPNVTSAISDIQGRVSTVENDVSGLKTTVNGHTTSINNLNSDVSGLKTTVDGHTTSINNLNSDVSGLKTTVDSHTASINALDTDVANLQIDKADVNDSNQSIVAGSISATNITKGGVNVATVNDIPSVPDISGKADLNNSSQTIVAGTINATNINKNGVAVATTSDIPDISGKVDKAQGIANAGKVLGINASGNVEPTVISGGGEEWEEIDKNNLPTDWSNGDRIKIQFRVDYTYAGAGSFTSAPKNASIKETSLFPNSSVNEFIISDDTYQCWAPLKGFITTFAMGELMVTHIFSFSNWNAGTDSLFNLQFYVINGGGISSDFRGVTRTTIGNYVEKMWRLKK